MSGQVGRAPDRFLTSAVVWCGPGGAWEITASSSSAGPGTGEVVMRSGTSSLRHDTDGVHLAGDQLQALLIDLASAGRVATSTIAIESSTASRAAVSAAARGHARPTEGNGS